MAKKICVIGSLNMDYTIGLPRFHQPGETITGTSFALYPGGKGGNQAVAAARLGGQVAMAGRLGDDTNGALYREILAREGVDVRFVETSEGVCSGMAMIEVDEKGENRIAIVPGSNAMVDCAQVDRLLAQAQDTDIFMMQLEIPMDTVLYAARLLSKAGKTLLLDPAPAVPLPDALMACVDYITPNETELHLLTGMPTDTDEQVAAAAKALLARGCRRVVAKMGRRGAMLVTQSGCDWVRGFTVNAVDTTAAGDSFNAGLAVALAGGEMPERACVRFANAVGALSTTGAGAQGAMPTLAQVRALMEAQPEAGE